MNQTYRNIEIIISDNSTADDTEQLIKGYDDTRIKYLRNADFLGDYDNPAAEYVNWLMDGDVFYPNKIERMVEIYRANPDVSLVTSKRNVIDADGFVVDEATTPFSISSKIDGDEAGRILFSNFSNYIGEPTTVLVCKKFLRDDDLHWSESPDLMTWCQLLTRGKLYFIDEVLSGSQAREDAEATSKAIEWARLIAAAWERATFLTTETELRTAILAWFELLAVKGLQVPLQKDYRGAEVEKLEKVFVAMAQALSNGYKIELPPVGA